MSNVLTLLDYAAMGMAALFGIGCVGALLSCISFWHFNYLNRARR